MSIGCNSPQVYLAPETEKKIRNRLRRLGGQVSGIERMLEEHKSCDDILVQIAALKQAVNGVAAELLQAHVESCVLPRVEAGAAEGRDALESLKAALGRVMKHG